MNAVMVRSTKLLGLQLALLAALAVTASPAPGAPLPRVTLSVPTDVIQATPAIAKGTVAPAHRGRVLLQVRRANAWRAVAAGRVRQGRFRISFVFRQAVPSSLRIRATLLRGDRPLASSPIHKVRIHPAHTAPEPRPAPPAAPTSAVAAGSGSPPAAGSPGGGGEPPAGGEPSPGGEELPGEEPPGGGEEEPPPVPPGNAYWGAWIGSQLTGEAAPWDMNAVTEFEQMTEKPLSLIEFSSPWADCSSSPCSDYAFPWDPFDAIRAHGSIPFFSWGSEMFPGTPNQPEFQLADIISGAHDNYIRAWATRAAEWGHPFFLRFDWEMNGDWFPWGEGVNENQPGEFVAAWRHVHDIFTSVGATNATWVWCPYVNKLSLYASLYPGDSYVDWTCLDGYNWGTNPAAPYGWRTFDSLYEKAYAKVTTTIAPSKPMVIGEVASSEYGGSKAGWIEEMFEALEKRYPQIRALIWFETLSNGEDWPLESSESAEGAFATGIGDSRFLGNVFGTAATSPIPAP